MDTLSAFAMGEASRDKELMVFDWDKAAGLIKEHGAQDASAGLCNDWGFTGGQILEKGKPVFDCLCYLASTWATPEIEINDEINDCYKMQSDTPNWGSDTVWPESALEILKS